MTVKVECERLSDSVQTCKEYGHHHFVLTTRKSWTYWKSVIFTGPIRELMWPERCPPSSSLNCVNLCPPKSLCWSLHPQGLRMRLYSETGPWERCLRHNDVLNVGSDWVWLVSSSVAVQLLSCVQPCDPVDCSMPGFPVLHDLLELARIPVHWVGDAIQPSPEKRQSGHTEPWGWACPERGPR